MEKSGLKTGVHHAIFSVLEVKRSRILLIFNKRGCFCLHSWVHFYGVSRAKTNLRNTYMMFGSFFEQYYLLNLIILGVYAKR